MAKDARDAVVAKLLTAAGCPDPESDTPAQAACRKLAAQIGECGRHPTVWVDDSRGRVIRSLGRCGQRLCPVCAAERAKDTARRVATYVDAMDSLAMVTLTVASDDRPLADQVDHLIASARRLRQSVAWQAHCAGGVQCLEVTRSPSTGQWHPHLHILCDWRYWAQRSLAAAWQVASRGSSVVDVRRVHSRAAAARYVTKYIAKAADCSAIPAAAMPEWVTAWHGRRRIQSFGNCHGIRTAPPQLPRDQPLRHVAHLEAVREDALSGGELAARLLRSLADLPPWPHTDQPTDECRRAHAACLAQADAWRHLHDQRILDHISPPRRRPPRPPRQDDAMLPWPPP